MNKDRQIHFMQIRMIRKAASKWGVSYDEAVTFMEKNHILQYIFDFFEIFHTESDEAVFDDIEKYLESKGAVYGKRVS